MLARLPLVLLVLVSISPLALGQQPMAKASVPSNVKVQPQTVPSKSGTTIAKASSLADMRRAALQGHPKAPLDLGIAYSERGNHREAARWYHMAARGGDRGAMAALGAMYERGMGVPRDRGEALRWFQRAASRGSRMAQDAVARLQSR